MPNLPISQLPELTAITSNAEFAVAQGGTTYKVKAGFASSGNLHGSFHSEFSQSATSTTDAYSLSAETADFSSGVSVVDGSKFTVSSGGTFNLQFSAVFEKTQGGSIEYVSIWLAKNGSNIAWTNTDLSMANNNEYVIAAWNFVEEMNAGDYLELKWRTSTLNMVCTIIGPQSNPTRPATPSVIVTVTQI